MKDLRLMQSHHHHFSGIEVNETNGTSLKLKRENRQLQKERNQFLIKNQKQELCIIHLLKRLQEATKQASEKQANYDHALQHQSHSLDSMFQELSSSREEVKSLKSELAFAKNVLAIGATTTTTTTTTGGGDAAFSTRNSTNGSSSTDVEIMEDISDEDTALITNSIKKKNSQSTDKTIQCLENEIAQLRYSLIQQNSQYSQLLRDNQNRIDQLERENKESAAAIHVQQQQHDMGEEEIEFFHPHASPSSPDTDIDIPIVPMPNPITQSKSLSYAQDKTTRSGLQEDDDDDAPRPLIRKSSSLRGFSSLESSSSSSSSHETSILKGYTVTSFSERSERSSMHSQCLRLR